MQKGNIVPIHKKGDKQISLLLICGKIYEELILNEILIYFSASKLISKSQSGFQPGDSCINQLLSIIRETFIF